MAPLGQPRVTDGCRVNYAPVRSYLKVLLAQAQFRGTAGLAAVRRANCHGFPFTPVVFTVCLPAVDFVSREISGEWLRKDLLKVRGILVNIR